MTSNKKKNKDSAGFVFVLPWVIGFIVFTVIPMIAAVYISMTDWSILGNSNFIGIENYLNIFKDEKFYKALMVTIRYAVFAIPLTIMTALLVAVCLNFQSKSIGIFRVIFYIPSIVSGVAVAIVFKWILDPGYGLLNSLLSLVGIHGPNWLYDPDWVLPSYLIMALWGASSGYLTYLAALKDVPRDLYESAKLEGAGFLKRTVKITVPLISPIIFYNMVMGIIAAFRKFSDAYIMGGAGEEGNFYMVYLYQRAFSYYDMGYATALAWILFAVILTLTAIINITKKYWVYNEED
jgi:multiple sugar transport system permease protein